MKNVLITSDGTPAGTVVVDDEGNKIERVRNMTIECEPESLVTAYIEIGFTSLNVTAHVVEVSFICPVCKDQVDHQCRDNC